MEDSGDPFIASHAKDLIINLIFEDVEHIVEGYLVSDKLGIRDKVPDYLINDVEIVRNQHVHEPLQQVDVLSHI